MKLRNDPYRIFQSSKTPAGLYARQKWLAEAGTQSWKSDYRQTVDALLAAPLPDGKRYADAVATITRLFGLHLTVRTCSAPIAAALKWLLDRIVLEADTLTIDLTETHPAPNLNGLPFTAGEPTLLYTGATLFLATIFARGSDPAVLASYRWVCAAENRWQADAAAGHNMLRALVVHPEFSRHPAAARAVEALAGRQTEDGDWGPRHPFYQTLNALAHLDSPAANRQLDRAFGRLRARQRSDGSWGRIEPEWNTFLAVHALKNKGLL